jgi:hypothetical protein
MAFVELVQALLASPTELPAQAGLLPEWLAGSAGLGKAKEGEATDHTPLSDVVGLVVADASQPLHAVFLPPAPPAVAAASTAAGDAAELAVGRQLLPLDVTRQREPLLAGLNLSLSARQEAVSQPLFGEVPLLPEADSETLPGSMLTVMPDRVAEVVSRATQTQLTVPTPVASREWSSDFSQRVLWMAGQRIQFAEIAVNPPNLGGVEVRLSMNDQGAGAQFFAASATVRDALESALPRLRDMLAEAGISLLQAEVRDQAFAERQTWQASQEGESPASAPVHVLPLHRAGGLGLIDLYA